MTYCTAALHELDIASDGVRDLRREQRAERDKEINAGDRVQREPHSLRADRAGVDVRETREKEERSSSSFARVFERASTDSFHGMKKE